MAPAGDEAALRAAVCAGADAVYLGFRAFGARASAANFGEEELARAVEYAHLHQVRVHVTVNTLVKEREMETLYRALETIARAQADAVIVQDLGVASLVKGNFPTLALHASTQMAIHNATGARFAKEAGFERVVLARECGLCEIRRVAQTGVETEVFVHGALCASVSGQCLLSSMAGGRSGNRGRCAQPCRQMVSLGDHSGALLSMKDLCLRDHLQALEDAGVCSLKIEGRLKRPEYVAIVTDSYRRALDELAAGQPCAQGMEEKESLMQIFHRGGFTAGHALGAEDADLCAVDHVGHGGILMGQVLREKNGLAVMKLERVLHDGDGLQLRGRREMDLRYSGKDRQAGEEAVLRLRPGESAWPGDRVYRLTDTRQMGRAESLMQEKPILLSMEAVLEVGKPISLTVTDGETRVTLLGESVQAAKTRGITAEEVRKQLGKLGDTPFAVSSSEAVAVSVAQDAFVPVSAVNALRREAVLRLMKARAEAFWVAEKAKQNELPKVPWGKEPQTPAEPLGEAESWKDKLAVRFSDVQLAGEFQARGAELLIFAPLDLDEALLDAQCRNLPQGAWLELPPQLTEPAVAMFKRLAARHAGRLGGVVLSTVGQLGADFALPLALGTGVPLTNALALKAVSSWNPRFFLLWPELSFEELCHISPPPIAPLLTVYGRERVMLLNHCPLRVAKGAGKGRASCSYGAKGETGCPCTGATLTDRKGYRFPLQRLRTPEGCVVSVWNALPTDLRKQGKARKELGAGMLLNFTVESPQEQLGLVEEFAALRNEAPVPLKENQKTTQGHFLRGVE